MPDCKSVGMQLLNYCKDISDSNCTEPFSSMKISEAHKAPGYNNPAKQTPPPPVLQPED